MLVERQTQTQRKNGCDGGTFVCVCVCVCVCVYELWKKHVPDSLRLAPALKLPIKTS